MPTLEIGTGFNNQETRAFCEELVNKGVLKEFGRMIEGVNLRFENSSEQNHIEDMTVDEVKELLSKHGVNYQ